MKNPMNSLYDIQKQKALDGLFSPGKRELLMKDPSLLNIGERIRRERYLRSCTLEQMASYLDISTSYLGAIERGARPVSKSMMERLHSQLGLSYDYLLEGLSVTGTMIRQFVRESSAYESSEDESKGTTCSDTRHKIDVLLAVCTPEEEIAIFNMIHTFLAQVRSTPKKMFAAYQRRNDHADEADVNTAEQHQTVSSEADFREERLSDRAGHDHAQSGDGKETFSMFGDYHEFRSLMNRLEGDAGDNGSDDAFTLIPTQELERPAAFVSGLS